MKPLLTPLTLIQIRDVTVFFVTESEPDSGLWYRDSPDRNTQHPRFFDDNADIEYEQVQAETRTRKTQIENTTK